MSKLLTKAEFWIVVFLSAFLTYLFKFHIAELTPWPVCVLPGALLVGSYLHCDKDIIFSGNLHQAQEARETTSPIIAQKQRDEVSEQISLLRKELLAGLHRLENRELTIATPAPAGKTESSEALNTALQQIGQRDEVINRLTTVVTKGNVNMVLIRLTQALEIALALHQRISNGQSDPVESIQFIVDDLESALAGQGVEHMVIVPGTRIPDLKAGSFTAIAVVEAPSPELNGTVKEVRTRAYYINEENRIRFVSPAKLVLYKA